MMNCKTLGEAFEKSSRYSRIVGNLIQARPQFLGNKIKVIFFTPPHTPKMSRHCFDAVFSSSMRMMRTLTGEPIHPLEVTFTYSKPDSTTEYQRIFNCPVLFEHKHNSYTIHLKNVYLPVLYANPSLLAYFENYAQEFLSGLEQQNETTCAVTKIILAKLDDEKLSISKVAREMSVSVRTLQYRLKQEGVYFSGLITDIRKKLAKKYLHDNYSVEEITYLLGFSEPSVFRKAFKKWSGVTPREYRKQSYPTATNI